MEKAFDSVFAALSDVRDEAVKEWEQFRDAACEVAEQKIGYKKKNVKKWISPATLTKQEEVRQAKIELNQDISDTSRKDKYKKDQKELKERITEDKNRYYEEQIQEMEEAGRRKDCKKLFSVINKLAGKEQER